MNAESCWRAVQCRTQSELAVADALRGLNLPVFCPQYKVLIPRRGRHRIPIAARGGTIPISPWLREKLMPFIRSYVFAQFDPDDPHMWHDVKNQKNVLRILPGLVDGTEIERLRGQIGYDAHQLSDEAISILKYGISFEIRDLVTITQGVFASKTGRIMVIDKDFLSAGIKIPLLGREIVVNQPLAWLEPRARGNRHPNGSPDSAANPLGGKNTRQSRKKRSKRLHQMHPKRKLFKK